MKAMLDIFNHPLMYIFITTSTIATLLFIIHTTKKQNQNTVFMFYNERNHNICLSFPINIDEQSFSFDALESYTREKTLRYMHAYFDICSEKHYLYLNRSIDKSMWKEWDKGIKYTLSKKAFRDAWSIINSKTIYVPSFVTYMQKIIGETSTNERYIRWQDYRITQLSYSINIFLGFSVASLAFLIGIILKNFENRETLKPTILIWAISAVCGCIATITRLLDFRSTAGKILNPTPNNCLVAKYSGGITWGFFWSQVLAYALGCLLFIYTLFTIKYKT